MKINENGITREMTAEEIAEHSRMMAEMEINREPTIEEQLTDLAEYISILTDMLLGGAGYGD